MLLWVFVCLCLCFLDLSFYWCGMVIGVAVDIYGFKCTVRFVTALCIEITE